MTLSKLRLNKKSNGKYTRKESHHAKDLSISILEHLGTEYNWKRRKEILLPLLSKSVEDLKSQYEVDHTSMGIIRPKKIIDFIATPIDRCRDWENDPVLGIQQTLAGIYKSPLEKIPFKFSYVFECDDPSCKIQHDLMIEDWEICQLYRSEKQRVGEKESLVKVAEKYNKEKFLNSNDLYFTMGTRKQLE